VAATLVAGFVVADKVSDGFDTSQNQSSNQNQQNTNQKQEADIVLEKGNNLKAQEDSLVTKAEKLLKPQDTVKEYAKYTEVEDIQKEQDNFAKLDEESFQQALELSIRWFAAEELGREANEKINDARGKVDSSQNKGTAAKRVLLRQADGKIEEAIDKLVKALESGTPELVLKSLNNCKALCIHYGNQAAIERVNKILSEHYHSPD
jgi:hypothetical protein